MKNWIAILLTGLFITTLSCSSQKEGKPEELALKVEGMVCEYGCAKYIEKQISGLSGVKDCMVSFNQNTALISFDGNQISADEIKTVINGLNDGQYKVEEIDLLEKPEKASEDKSGNNHSKESAANVSFQFPQLITYFMKHVIR